MQPDFILNVPSGWPRGLPDADDSWAWGTLADPRPTDEVVVGIRFAKPDGTVVTIPPATTWQRSRTGLRWNCGIR